MGPRWKGRASEAKSSGRSHVQNHLRFTFLS
ncbi:hypothetical protein CISIN_1g043831mg, partial [Citrus sinensis]